MPSGFDEILKANSENTEAPWREFAKLTRPIYSDIHSNWGGLAYGYKAAADIVAAEQIDGCCRPDLFSPIFFLYRHYIELELKAIWIKLAHHGLLAKMPKGDHFVMDLWNGIQSAIVREQLINADDEFVAKVRNTIALIDQIDRRSTKSRYPDSKDSTSQVSYHAISVKIHDLVCAADDFETFSYALYEIMRARYEMEL